MASVGFGLEDWDTSEFGSPDAGTPFDFSDATPTLIFATPTGMLFKLDSSEPLQDGKDQAPVAIPVTVRTPWLHFGDPSGRKDFNEWEVMSPDPDIKYSLEAASNSDEFAQPLLLVTDRTPVLSPFGDRKVYLAGTKTNDRFYRITFESLTGQTRGFLDGYSAEVIPEHKL